MNVKKWFENGTGLKIKELRYLSPPQIPYNIFVDDQSVKGADLYNNIVEHNIVIEHYSEILDDAEIKIISNFLDNEKMKFEKSAEWLSSEKLFVTIFSLETFFEKIGKDG